MCLEKLKNVTAHSALIISDSARQDNFYYVTSGFIGVNGDVV
jgi:hypothetical protein